MSGQKRKIAEMILVHVALSLGFVALIVLALQKANTPVTAENTTHQQVAFDRGKLERDGHINLYAGEKRYYVTCVTPEMERVLADCGTGARYEVHTRRVNDHDGPDYDRIFALTGLDGTAYLTFEQSSARERDGVMIIVWLCGGMLALTGVSAAVKVSRMPEWKSLRQSRAGKGRYGA